MTTTRHVLHRPHGRPCSALKQLNTVSNVGRCWDNAYMGSKSKLQIDTQELASAGGKATQTLAGSVAPTFAPPPPTATSKLDAALVGVIAKTEAVRTNVDTTDSTWATKQQAALTQSPPVFTQQDQQGAQDYTRVATEFPTPVMNPGGTTGPEYA